jgi:kinesin family member 18/19
VSYLELYNERVRDLLAETDQDHANLKIVEDPQRGVQVVDLSEIIVSDAAELMELINIGNKRRFVANTGWNKFSSRSHAILIFNIEGVKQTPQGMLSVRSKLQMIDLAGSERAASSENRGLRM